VTGGAIFPDIEQRYRTVLWRCWGPDGERAPYALFVGMNPSTANASANDPTCAREMGFTRRWRLTHYRKVNVSAYRATDPSGLVRAAAEGIEIDTLANRLAIATEAAGAHLIVAAFGRLSGDMRHYAEAVRHRVWQGKYGTSAKLVSALLKLSHHEQVAAVCRQLRGRDALWRADPPIRGDGH
jgi:hypothetical protein